MKSVHMFVYNMFVCTLALNVYLGKLNQDFIYWSIVCTGVTVVCVCVQLYVTQRDIQTILL